MNYEINLTSVLTENKITTLGFIFLNIRKISSKVGKYLVGEWKGGSL